MTVDIALLFITSLTYLLNIIISFKIPNTHLKKPLIIFSIFNALDQFILGTLFPAGVYIWDPSYQPNNEFSLYLFFLFLVALSYSLLFYFLIIFFKKRLKVESNQIVLNDNLVLRNAAILCFFSFFLWAIVTRGVSLYNARYAYQYLRSGIGPIWSLGCVSTSIFLAVKIASNKLNLRSLLLIFYISSSYGSKALILNVLITFLLAKDFKFIFNESSIKKYLIKFKFLIVFITILSGFSVMLIYLFAGLLTNGLDHFVTSFGYYFTSFVNANTFLNEKSAEFAEIKSNLYLSSFWRFVPRILYPDKPYIYGSTSAIEFFYPGVAEQGKTPGFAIDFIPYLNFGFWGIIPSLISKNIAIIFLACFYLSNKFRISNGIALYTYTYLILPFGIASHFPTILTILIVIFIYRLKY